MASSSLPMLARAFGSAAAPVILHGFPTSSTSFLARFALNAKGVKYEQKDLPLVKRPDGRPDAEGQKPHLDVGDTRVEKPGAIFNFVNENFDGPPLLPADTKGRAHSRAIATLCATDVAPYGYYRVTRLLTDKLGVNAEGVEAWHRYWLENGFKEIEGLLAAGKFCHGDNVTMADIFVMPQVHWSQMKSGVLKGGFDLSPFPQLQKAYQQCLATEAFQKALPENQPGYAASL
ncbi:unnamed protein product [Pedinophyceae sp. YPF-701]|nr:unnamed protein product [Pedinophyceae sp. YPF-701]